MQRLEVSGAVRPIYGSLGVKRLTLFSKLITDYCENHMKRVKQTVCMEGGMCSV